MKEERTQEANAQKQRLIPAPDRDYYYDIEGKVPIKRLNDYVL
jgi:hypothetical protein